MNVTDLLPYQAEAYPRLLQALRTHGAALDGSDMGIGKTYMASAVIRELGLPALVVAPKVTLPAWERVMAQMGTEASLVNWEMVGRRLQYGHWLPLARRQKYARFAWNPEIKFLVFDEAHRAKGQNTDNSFFVRAARACGIPALALSATAAQSPVDMQALAYLLRLYTTDFWSWARKFGCYPGTFGGLKFVDTFEYRVAVLKRLHHMIFEQHELPVFGGKRIIEPRGIRLRAADVGDFPESQIRAELYDVADPARVDQLYAEMKPQLDELRAKRSNDADLEHPLTRILRARQELELLKVPTFVELAQDAMASGYSVAIFMNFTESLQALAAKLRTRNIVDGSQSGARGESERQDIVDCFQANHSNLILLNVRAGGVGVRLHDEHGGHPRVAFHSPTYGAYDFRQASGRVQSASAKSKSVQRIVLAARTVEVKIQHVLERKLENLDLLNDGDCVIP